MGGSTTTVTPNVQQTAEPNYGNIPGFSQMSNSANNMMASAYPSSYLGAGYQGLPKQNLGSVELAGPNATGAANSGSNYNGSMVQGGSNNVAANQTGNSSLGSVLGSLGGLLGGTQVPQGLAQGLAGTSPAGFGQAGQLLSGMNQAPYGQAGQTSMGGKGQAGGHQMYPGGTPGGPPIAQQQQGQTGTGAMTEMESPVTGQATTTNQAATSQASLGGQAPGTSATNQAGTLGAGGTFNSDPSMTGIPSANQSLNSSYGNSFMGSNMTSPYYNQAAVAGNLGTSSGQSVGSAGNFMNSLFSPGLSQMSQDYLQAGTANAGINLQQGISQLQNQYQSDPFNTALGRSEANLVSQTANNTLQTAAGMGVQQQQIAANQMATPYNLTEQAAAVPVSAAQGLYNTAQSAYQAPYQLEESLLSQTPISSPAVGSTTNTSSKIA